MKKLIFLILVCLLYLNCVAQFPNAGDNVKNDNVDKFIGTWLWHNGNDSLLFIFKKENVYVKGFDIHMDVLIGFHKFVKNGVVIENSTEYINTWQNDGHSTLYGGTDRIVNLNTLTTFIEHTSKNKSVNAEIQYIDSNHIKIISIENPEGMKIRFPGEAPYDWSISIPTNIIFTRQ